MSWASHDLEPYVIQRFMGRRVMFVPLLLGSYAPDLATKWVVYGTHVFGYRVAAGDPARFHRGWPGVGFTHSPLFGVLVALVVIAATGNKLWAFSFMIGQWAHAFTDVTDTVGTMLLFPFSTHIFSIGLWKYAAEAGRLGDGAAYFSGPAVVWDCLWVVLVALSWRVLTRDYFHTVVAPNDKFWAWAGKRAPEPVLLALYRTSAFYGTFRLLAWILLGARGHVARVRHLVGWPALDQGGHEQRAERRRHLRGLLISALIVTFHLRGGLLARGPRAADGGLARQAPRGAGRTTGSEPEGRRSSASSPRRPCRTPPAGPIASTWSRLQRGSGGAGSGSTMSTSSCSRTTRRSSGAGGLGGSPRRRSPASSQPSAPSSASLGEGRVPLSHNKKKERKKEKKK